MPTAMSTTSMAGISATTTTQSTKGPRRTARMSPGLIAGNANDTGIVGVAPSVRIMAVKVFDNGATCGTDQQAIDAIAYAAANGALIINASWGAPAASESLGDAIESIPDVLVVAAAGNGGPTASATTMTRPPSIRPPTTCRTSSQWQRSTTRAACQLSPTSAPPASTSRPLARTCSARWSAGSFAYGDGTSMAAANTSGVAALAASAWPSLLQGDAPALREHLIATAKALPSTLGWVASPRLVDARASMVHRPDIRRLSGANRFATAAAISEATFVPFVPYLFIATGMGFPDALAGGAAAAPDRNSAAPRAAERHPGGHAGRDPATTTMGDLRPRRHRRGVERRPWPARPAQLQRCFPASPERTATRRPWPSRRASCRACRMSSSPPASASPTRLPAFRPAVCSAGRCC